MSESRRGTMTPVLDVELLRSGPGDGIGAVRVDLPGAHAADDAESIE